MILSWLQAILLAVVQGICCVLPLTDSGFSSIARKLMGLPLSGSSDGLLLGILWIVIAIVILATFREDWRYALWHDSTRKGRHASETAQLRSGMSARMIILMLAGLLPNIPALLGLEYVSALREKLLPLTGVLILGGLLIFSCDRVGHGRRELTEVTLADGLLVGLFQAIGLLPGLSAVGLGIVMGIWRGMEPAFSVRFSCLLLVPVLLIRGLVGIYSYSSSGFQTAYLLAAAVCALCAYLSLRLLRFVAQRGKVGEFAYPVWGAAVFTFILFLFS